MDISTKTKNCILADGLESLYRVAVPAGNATLLLSLVPETVEKGCSFAGQADELANRVEQFIREHGFVRADCSDLVVFIGRLEDMASAAEFGKSRLPAKSQTTVLTKLRHPAWRVAMNVYFSRKVNHA